MSYNWRYDPLFGLSDLDPWEIETYIGKLKSASYVKQARHQALLDGAILAAEQVQDKRLEFVEKSNIESFPTWFEGVLISFLLDSPILGTLVRLCLQPTVASQSVLKVFSQQKGPSMIASAQNILTALNSETNSAKFTKYFGWSMVVSQIGTPVDSNEIEQIVTDAFKKMIQAKPPEPLHKYVGKGGILLG